MKKLSKISAIILTSLLAFSTLFVAPTVFADNDICNNANVSQAVKDAHGCPSATSQTLENSVISIINAVILVAGLVAVVFIVIGGVSYMTSTGDPSKTKKAKDTILYAVIGLVICALSAAIVNFVIINVLKQVAKDDESEKDKSSSLVLPADETHHLA